MGEGRAIWGREKNEDFICPISLFLEDGWLYNKILSMQENNSEGGGSAVKVWFPSWFLIRQSLCMVGASCSSMDPQPGLLPAQPIIPSHHMASQSYSASMHSSTSPSIDYFKDTLTTIVYLTDSISYRTHTFDVVA